MMLSKSHIDNKLQYQQRIYVFMLYLFKHNWFVVSLEYAIPTDCRISLVKIFYNANNSIFMLLLYTSRLNYLHVPSSFLYFYYPLEAWILCRCVSELDLTTWYISNLHSPYTVTQCMLFQIGSWDRRQGVNITVTKQQQRQDDLERLRNSTLRVVTIFVSTW